MLGPFGLSAALAIPAMTAMVFGVAGVTSAVPLPDTGPDLGGTTISLPIPEGVEFTEVNAGDSDSLAIATDGNAYAWGGNSSGQLGDGTNTGSRVPVRVSPVDGVTFTEVSSGNFHTIALGSDGKVYAWGNNDFGQLGDGTNTSRNAPVLVWPTSNLTFTAVAAGYSHSLALGTDGNLYAWGDNQYGELGDGTSVSSSLPVLVNAPAVGVTLSGVTAGNSYSMALGSDGTAYAWGANALGQLGNGAVGASNNPSPVVMPPGVSFSSLSAGSFHSLGLAADGRLFAWGSNFQGQLGLGSITFTPQLSPTFVTSSTDLTFTQINAGHDHSLAMASSGELYAWGSNGFGQLGIGNTTNRTFLVPVLKPAGVNYTQFSSRYNHALAVGDDGNTYAWGVNNNGQLGDGTDVNMTRPALVAMPDRVVTEVTFGGVAGVDLVNNPDGTVSVTTPPHAAGVVDVVVAWTLSGVVQTPVTYPDGFTFISTAVPVGSVSISKVVVGAAPAGAVYDFVVRCDDVDHPGSATAGGTAVIPDLPAGVVCQVLETNAHGATKTSYSADEVTVVADQLTAVTVTNTFESTGGQNPPGTGPGPGTGSGTGPGSGTHGGLASTGVDSQLLLWGATAALLAMGVGVVLVVLRRVRKQRADD